jgi:hypothetical protein
VIEREVAPVLLRWKLYVLKPPVQPTNVMPATAP